MIYVALLRGINVGGNNKIIMCERGIRTYNDYTRNTLDIAAVPIIKKETIGAPFFFSFVKVGA